MKSLGINHSLKSLGHGMNHDFCSLQFCITLPDGSIPPFVVVEKVMFS